MVEFTICQIVPFSEVVVYFDVFYAILLDSLVVTILIDLSIHVI